MKENMKSFNKENIVLISENIKNMKSGTNPGHFLEDRVTLLWKPVPLFVRLPIPNFRAIRTLNDEVQIFELTSRRGDVATWRRRDVVTSLTSALLTQRRDVGTSRRDSHFLACSSLFQKLLPKVVLFAPSYLYPKTNTK